MDEQKKSSRQLANNLQNREKKISAALEEMAFRLRRLETQLWQQAGLALALESRISAQVGRGPSRLAEKSDGQDLLEGSIALEEGNSVDLQEWEKRMDEKYALLSTKEKELQNVEKRIYTEVDKRLADVKQRDLLLAREVEMRSLKQTLGSRPGESESLSKRPGGKGAARLVSFLTDIGKRH